MRTGSMRISKKTWQAWGGCENSQLWRRMRQGKWEYYCYGK